MWFLRASAVSCSVVFLLACGGLFGGSKGTPPGQKPNPDAGDLAERARLQREYTRAEAILKNRLKKAPDDAHAHRLLGDVNLTRGQDFAQRWKRNLGRSLKQYEKAVQLEPENCQFWSRLSGAVAMADVNPETKVDRAFFDALPWDKAWSHCTSAAVNDLRFRMLPTEEELSEVAKANPKIKPYEQQLQAAPWKKESFDKLPLGHVSWTEGPGPAEPGARPFVVLQGNATASGVGHQYSRPVKAIETFRASRVAKGKVVFTDRRYPKKLPRKAIVKANACAGTRWKDNSAGVPIGSCTTGAFKRGSSGLYDPATLVAAGPGHYNTASVQRAAIPGEEVMFESVRCTGGPIQRKFGANQPTCPVAYDKPNWLQRSLPVSAGVFARDSDHAERMIAAERMRPVLGDELTDRMVRGDVGIGMPYSLVRFALGDPASCRGRALLARHLINGGQLEWTCVVDDRAYLFIDSELTWMGKSSELDGAASPPKE